VVNEYPLVTDAGMLAEIGDWHLFLSKGDEGLMFCAKRR